MASTILRPCLQTGTERSGSETSATYSRSVTRYDGDVFKELDVWGNRALGGVERLAATGDAVWLGGANGLYRYRRSLFRPTVIVDDITTDKPLGNLSSVHINTSKNHLAFSLHPVSLN